MLVIVATDAELIARAQNGDRVAFHDLVVRHEKKVAGIICGMMGRGPEAEDVGQEVFIRFYKSMDAFKGESALSTYLGRIAINLSLNALNHQKLQRQRFMTGSELPQYGNTEQEKRQEAREIVEKALAVLEPEFRSVIVLRMIEGYSTQETAEMLALPQGTVLSRLSRAQEKLKVILEKLR